MKTNLKIRVLIAFALSTFLSASVAMAAVPMELKDPANSRIFRGSIYGLPILALIAENPIGDFSAAVERANRLCRRLGYNSYSGIIEVEIVTKGKLSEQIQNAMTPDGWNYKTFDMDAKGNPQLVLVRQRSEIADEVGGIPFIGLMAHFGSNKPYFFKTLTCSK